MSRYQAGDRSYGMPRMLTGYVNFARIANEHCGYSRLTVMRNRKKFSFARDQRLCLLSVSPALLSIPAVLWCLRHGSRGKVLTTMQRE
jgi:hypothetical protein